MEGHGRARGNYLSVRGWVLGLGRILLLSLWQLPFGQSSPLHGRGYANTASDEEPPKSAQNPSLWLYLGVAGALVLLGGAFAGLTIALMGQVYAITILKPRRLMVDRMKFICK